MNKKCFFYTAIGYTVICFLFALISYIGGGPRGYLVSLAGTAVVIYCLVDGLKARRQVDGAENVKGTWTDGR